jgi:dUTP pyrophosphatase
MKSTNGSAGYDVYASISKDMILHPGERKCIPTGIKTAFDPHFEIQIRSRSGLAMKHGICVLNSPGTIDSDYRGEIGILLINHGSEEYTVKNGDRIAQMVISKVYDIDFEEVHMFRETSRKGGFGSTGI